MGQVLKNLEREREGPTPLVYTVVPPIIYSLWSHIEEKR